jgi:hypothetical protein
MGRRRVLLALVLVAVALVAALGVAPYIVPGYTTPFQRADLLLQGIERTVGLFLLLTGFAVGITVIHDDLESGAAVAILAKPVSRLDYAAAKAAAALATQVLVAAALAATTALFLVLYGATDYDYGAVTTYFLAGTANVLILVLALMALTTVVNNIVAAVLGFVAYQGFGAITTVHDIVVGGAPIGSPWNELIGVVYPLVPHQLVGGLPREVVRAEVDAGAFAGAFAHVPGFDPYRGVPYPSDLSDILSWAAYFAVVGLLLYVAVRRRQV